MPIPNDCFRPMSFISYHMYPAQLIFQQGYSTKYEITKAYRYAQLEVKIWLLPVLYNSFHWIYTHVDMQCNIFKTSPFINLAVKVYVDNYWILWISLLIVWLAPHFRVFSSSITQIIILFESQCSQARLWMTIFHYFCLNMPHSTFYIQYLMLISPILALM